MSLSKFILFWDLIFGQGVFKKLLCSLSFKP